jgi:aryl-alcohol dehydrogenase-like predicted oxidoreductase
MDEVQIPHLDRPLSRLVMGSAWFHDEHRDRIEALLDAWVELGGTTIDTAENYSGGESEVVIGRWLRNSGLADRMVVISKGGHPYDGRNRVTAADIEADLLGSLDRLGLDRIDLYLLHRDDPSVPVGEILGVLNGHREAGRITAFGGSNWSTERLAEAQAYADANGVQGFSASSPNLSLAVWTEPPWEACVAASDAASRAWYATTRMPLIAWSSQASGWFAGPDRASDAVAMAGRRVYDTPDNRERYERAERLGRERGVSAGQIALAWVLEQPFPVIPVVGPRSVEHLQGNVAALDVRLSAAERAWLNLESDEAPATR